MLYNVSLDLKAAYKPLAVGGRHVLCVAPAEIPGAQRVSVSLVEIDPYPAERTSRTDFFGNRVIDVTFREPHAKLEFRLRARVERNAAAPQLDISTPLGDLAERLSEVRSLKPDSPHHFLSASPRIRLAPELAAYARAQISPDMSALAAVQAIGAALNRDMTFDADATDVDTPPEVAFAARHGVCQDFTHIMISGLRGLGVPAGYVSGFLRTLPPPGKERLEGADAMHAWVRAWVGPEMGWVEFDPTNNMMVATDHIVVAHGRDYADVSPMHGVLRSAGTQETTHTVDIVPIG